MNVVITIHLQMNVVITIHLQMNVVSTIHLQMHVFGTIHLQIHIGRPMRLYKRSGNLQSHNIFFITRSESHGHLQTKVYKQYGIDTILYFKIYIIVNTVALEDAAYIRSQTPTHNYAHPYIRSQATYTSPIHTPIHSLTALYIMHTYTLPNIHTYVYENQCILINTIMNTHTMHTVAQS